MTMEKIKVVADFDWLENEETIGHLGHESQRGTDVYTFEYDKDWLKRHPSLNLGKELQSFPGVQYNPTRNRIFGTFSDALPDRWGRRLIDLRIHQEMKDSGERRVNISDWDYLNFCINIFEIRILKIICYIFFIVNSHFVRYIFFVR